MNIFNQTISDEKAINTVLKGETEEFSVIVEKYKDRIFSIGYRFLKNRDEAEDFTQEIFLKVFKNLSSFNLKSSFKTWLLKIAYNHGINQVKAYKITSEFNEDYHLEEMHTPEKDHINGEIIAQINNAVESLPEKYKVSVDLFFFWGMKYSEISDVTGIPINTVKSNVFRAKKMLYGSLKGTIAEDYYEM